MESTHGEWGSYEMGDAHDEMLNMSHDDIEENDPYQDEYELEIGEDTDASKDKDDDDGFHSFYLVYLLLLLSFVFIYKCMQY